MRLVIIRNNLKGFVAESSKWCSKVVKLFKECYLSCKSNLNKGKILDFLFLAKTVPSAAGNLFLLTLVFTVAQAQ